MAGTGARRPWRASALARAGSRCSSSSIVYALETSCFRPPRSSRRRNELLITPISRLSRMCLQEKRGQQH